MTEVTDVIVARRQRPEPFKAMLVGSLAAHAGILAFLLFGPLDWRIAAETPRTVMSISLAGAPGPRAGGMTPMGGRAVPVPPPEATPRAMPPPPPKPAERVVPTRTRKPPAQPPPEKPQPGVTRTETGARGQGFGLSTGGSGGSG